MNLTNIEEFLNVYINYIDTISAIRIIRILIVYYTTL